MSGKDSGVLATGILTEAIVFFGLTTFELVTIIVVCLIIWTPILLVIGAVFLGNMLLSVGFILIVTLITSIIVGKWMQGVKRGKPDGHYKQMMNIRLSKTKLIGCKFIQLDGPLTLGRTTKVIRGERL